VQSGAEPGTRLDDRYKLDALLHQSGTGVTLWRATDEVLGRPVAVRIVANQTPAQRSALTAAATRAGRVPDARWVRVLDVGSDGSADQLRVWVVSEWVDGPSLATLLREAPLRGPIATGLIASCAQAVDIAKNHGASHGALHPDEVVLPADGNPRLTGLELSAALRPGSGEDDAQALGALLYAALTGRWPLPGWEGLPAPKGGDGRHPRRQRRGVSRELDQITAKALSGGYPDAAAFANALAELDVAPLHPPPVDPDRPRNPRWRRWAWRVVPPLLVATIGVGAWTLGSDLGRVPSPARAAAPSFPQPRQSNHTAATQVVWSTPPHITSFDPEGDGTEDPGGVGLAVDDDPSTQWTTDTYIGKPVFGGLKHGVGLLLDLRRPTTVDAAQLLLSAPGASFQLRAGSVRPVQASDLPVVASRTDSPASVRLTLADPVRARYWLFWITSLPKAGSGYRLGVSEIALLD
jgi:serine/threonine protein kinase